MDFLKEIIGNNRLGGGGGVLSSTVLASKLSYAVCNYVVWPANSLGSVVGERGL